MMFRALTAARAGAGRPGIRSALLHLLLLGATLVSACAGGPAESQRAVPPAAQVQRPAPEPAQAATVKEYDLRADEAFGGHTLQRHVGRSDDELRDRLRREPGISAASTYTDARMASRVVAATIDRSRGRVQTWVSRNGPRPNLVLTYRGSPGTVIGRSMARNARASEPCSNARVVLRWHDRAGRWIVLTSYPESE